MSKKPKKNKKPTRRSKVEFPALDPRYMPKVRQEYLDMDYINKLSNEEKKFLNKFIEEELNASFKKSNRSNLTKDPKKRKEIYNRNNARNRCLYGISKANNRLNDNINPSEIDTINNPQLTEDALIANIDRKKLKDQ